MKTTTFALTSILVAACGKDAKLPPKPINGAPVAFVAGALTHGRDGTVKAKAYNFSDKRVVQFSLMLRYEDAAGNLVKVPFGIDDLHEVGFASFGGKGFACNPKSWCEYTIETDVPEKAAKAEILATSLGSTTDNVTVDEKPLFKAESAMDWPAKSAARK